jgi:ribosomal protein S18 acetylase RimI-like enzyme
MPPVVREFHRIFGDSSDLSNVGQTFLMLPLQGDDDAFAFLRTVPTGTHWDDLLALATQYRTTHPVPLPVQPEIAVEGADALAAYTSISIAYRVAEVLDPESPSDSNGPLPFRSRALEVPVVKDYDSLPGNHPLDWPARFDIRAWGFLIARNAGGHVGGAVMVAQPSELEMLEGREDLALLWDIRVARAVRHCGIGSALLAAGEAWARARGATVLKVETQNTNVPACRFYAGHGFVLGSVRRGAYPELPKEIQFLWYKDLTRSTR